ncbi:hypothetical protein [uncultured Porphyromonas sp.]|uniref:hypothetical protein n=1 Tax=uncultured Porphyromonas sp. TaxID=159274 RepID=UPI00261E4F8D|nr:hypothetical protein [uncultured Porphyromonas sp.]
MEELDLDKLPRRMPYTVPEGTFDAIEHSVLEAIARESQADQVAPIPSLVPPAVPPAVPTGRTRPARARRLLPWLGSAVAVAAVTIWVVLTLAPHHQAPQPEVAPTLESVALAFEKLSPADQEFILSTYQDDMYMNF